MFLPEHPTYIQRRLHAQNVKLRQMSRDLKGVDATDPEAMKAAMTCMLQSLTEVTAAVGSLTVWAIRQR
ncbi:hypothetical protein [Sphingomonas sp. 3-13AW]|uniref:hypothetical protein n=1 Tax=Sphingomonas sp. 3-13AW TaxID=3050450 RepID=UPI003BB5F177